MSKRIKNVPSLADKLVADARKESKDLETQIETVRFWRDVNCKGNFKAQMACAIAIDKLKGYYK